MSTKHALKIEVKSSNVRKTTEVFIKRPPEDWWKELTHARKQQTVLITMTQLNASTRSLRPCQG